MNADRWQRIQSLFADARALDTAARDDFLTRACAGDAGLRAEVLALLAHDEAADGVVDRIVVDAASALLGERRLETQSGWIGRQLGAWRISEHLADGGMGAVYRAERADGQYRQQAAIKLINPAFVSRLAAGRLAAERQILARLEHPNIARLLDGGTTEDGAPYLVMEFVDGTPIDDYCNANALDTRARLRLFQQVCGAVDYAHRNLVVHRDLKPANILVGRDGQPKLLDFGIAKLVEAADATLTAADQRVLTPTHASPEQIKGEAITTATDVYALGVLLYELLSGRLPYAADSNAPGSAALMARRIVEGEPPPPSTAATQPDQGSNARLAALRRRGEQLTPERLRRELQGDLDNIVLMALRKEPQRRYPSVQALRDDIECFLTDRPVAARTDALSYRLNKYLRRHRVGVAVAAGMAVTLTAMASFYTWRLADERDRALAAEHDARETADFLARLLQGTGADAGASRQTSVQDVLDTAAARIREQLADRPVLGAQLRKALGSAYHSWGAYPQAEELLMEALALQRAQADAPSVVEAEILGLLGVVAHDRGDLSASLDWAQQEAARWRALGRHAELGTALTGIAISLRALGRVQQAERTYAEALAELRAAHGHEHREIAWALNNLGWLLHAQGRYAEARPRYEEALQMQQRLAVAPLETLQTLKNLGGLHYHLGDYDRAESLWKQATAMVDNVYGDRPHPARANMHALRVLIPFDRGDLAAAERHARSALEVNLAAVGPEHRRTAADYAILGRVLSASGRFDEAEAALRRSLAIRSARLPDGHVEMAASRLQLGHHLLRQGLPQRAEPELRAALAVFSRAEGGDPARRDEALRLLGLCVADLGRADDGEALIRQALAGQRQRLPADHWQIALTQALLTTSPFPAAGAPEAMAQRRTLLDDLRRRLGPRAPAVIEVEQRVNAQAVRPVPS